MLIFPEGSTKPLGHNEERGRNACFERNYPKTELVEVVISRLYQTFSTMITVKNSLLNTYISISAWPPGPSYAQV